MRYTKYTNQAARFQNRRAALFVDFENLFDLLGKQLDSHAHPDEFIAEAIDELRRYLIEEMRTPTSLVRAYADFSALGNNSAFIQRNLALQDCEPCFVPAMQPNAVEVRLAAEVMDYLHQRPDLTTFVIVTGDRMYLPLVQLLQRYGRTALVVMVSPHGVVDHIPSMGEELFVDVMNLLSGSTRKEILGDEEPAKPARPPSTRREPVVHSAITDPAGVRTLEIVEEHFGQYEEVYLTPLLRKLSELLDDNQHDPKSIINDLEDAGAVWLEKRRGFPYDYTVLIVDSEHPDVRQAHNAYYERTGGEPDEEYADDYYYENYDDDDDERPTYGDEADDFASADEEPLLEPDLSTEPDDED